MRIKTLVVLPMQEEMAGFLKGFGLGFGKTHHRRSLIQPFYQDVEKRFIRLVGQRRTGDQPDPLWGEYICLWHRHQGRFTATGEGFTTGNGTTGCNPGHDPYFG